MNVTYFSFALSSLLSGVLVFEALGVVIPELFEFVGVELELQLASTNADVANNKPTNIFFFSF